jgi:hypothetical protein
MNAPEPDTVRIFIPLKIKRRNGRPRIVPPEHIEQTQGRQQPHVLRAIARAWAWRRKLERGEAATLADITRAEGVDTSFVSRLMRLAYLSPYVLEQLVVYRRPCAVTLDQLAAAALRPWAEQPRIVFGE